MKHFAFPAPSRGKATTAARRFGGLADRELAALVGRLESQLAGVDPAASLLSSRLHHALVDALLAARAEAERRKC